MQAAIDSALEAYTGYREALNDALRRGDPRSKRLAQFAADQALADARANLLQLKGFGIVYTGEPIIQPTASRVALSDPRPTIDIVDCVDNSKWIPVYTASGKSAAAPGQNQRVPLNAQVQLFNGAWRVMSVKSDRSLRC